MAELRLPRLVGTRAAAHDLADDQNVPEDLTGQHVAIYGRNLVSGSQSFADELVEVLLRQRGADQLELIGVPEDFQRYVDQAASTRGVPDKIVVIHPVSA